MKKKSKQRTTPKKVSPSKKNKPDLLSIVQSQLGSFLNDLDCIQEAFRMFDPVLAEKDKSRRKEIDSLVEKLTVKDSKEGLSAERYEQITTFIAKIRRLGRGHILFRSNSLISLVSRFDEFIGDLIRGIHKQNPDRLKNSEKNLSYEEITSLTNLSQAIDRLIDKEVDRILRDSHVTQIKYLETQLNFEFREKLTVWPEFVELTERRNLLVHCGGEVSAQYIRICKTSGCKIEAGVKAGSTLTVSSKYFDRCHAVLVEIGLKLGQAVLRKIFSDQLDKIDRMINNYGVELLSDGRWDLGLMVFDFLCGLPPKLISKDQIKRIFIINKAIALKFSGKKSLSCELLDSLDWSSCSSDFALAIEVLRDNFDAAEKIMSSMNGEEPIGEPGFKTWPLFREFRKSEQFRRAFKKIYAKEFEPREEAKKAVGELQAGTTQITPSSGAL